MNSLLVPGCFASQTPYHLGRPICAPNATVALRPLRIAYLGRLAADKGIFETLTAAKILRDRGIAVQPDDRRLRTARDEIARAIEADRLGDRAYLVGALFGSAKQQLWQDADVLALATYREGLPYALLEAMAGGAVPVTTPVGAIPDVVQDGVHGLFVPARDPQALANALERLATTGSCCIGWHWPRGHASWSTTP